MKYVKWILLSVIVMVAWKTGHDLLPLPTTLAPAVSVRKVQVVDRQEIPLTVTYQNAWNIHDNVPLYDIPELLPQIFIAAEDKRFFEHHGVDWRARIHATGQNLWSRRVVRGASTITEQTVRMLHPRPRTFWSRWLEGFEAWQLEQRFSKADILEFYLNQVPYANQRRGVVQAARYYFDRDLDTLNLKEMLALAVLVRSPTRLDLRSGSRSIIPSLMRLAQRLRADGVITAADYAALFTMPLQLQAPQLPVLAPHFVNYLYTLAVPTHLQTDGRLHTTLNAEIQQRVQEILDQRVHDLQTKNVNNGAVVIADHLSGEILAWVNAHSDASSHIDAVLTPRQPGSTLKPFLYALALEKGWTAATVIDDAPLAEAVGLGMHSFRNYSRHYYGPLRLRDALGNSLNTPAVRTIQFVGVDTFLKRLHALGITSLNAGPDFYGDGLALGNGGITLLELVQACATLANRGVFQPLKVLRHQPVAAPVAVFDADVSSLIADILSDPEARRLEFGRGALLRLPVQTAVKTGTSTDYRDAWAVGFNYRYTVGVWLGNLDQQAMLQVSGSSGAALILRALFAELNRYAETQPLFLSPRLERKAICRSTGLLATADCPSQMEWFVPGTAPAATRVAAPAVLTSLQLKQPSEGLQLAMDPRIPDDHEALALVLDKRLEQGRVEWLVDKKVIGTTTMPVQQFLWPLARGSHVAEARVYLGSDRVLATPAVSFFVK